MAQITETVVLDLLNKSPFRVLTGGKQLTLAFGGLYIASTTLRAKPKLVWETEKSYPRYYVPIESLHKDVRAAVDGNGATSGVAIKQDVPISGSNGSVAKAVVEHVTVGSKTTSWVRFLDGSLKGLIRFERSEIGG